MTRSPLADEFDAAFAQTPGFWEPLRGTSLFITGGTGFFGSWLLESLVHANLSRGLGARATILTRDEAGFRVRRPRLASAPGLTVVSGDVRDFPFPPGAFTHVIHAATEASVRLNREQPALMRDVIVRGTSRALEFAQRSGAKRFLLASSGAVYGRQRPGVTHVAEEDPGAALPLETPSAYAEGKREAERLCVAAADRGLGVTIARGFAFVGAGLPLDGDFAIGNFIQDALNGRAIDIRGDGTPCRSSLYGSDLAAWLWAILLKGQPGRAYNVGSERRVSVAELASIVTGVLDPKLAVHIAGKPAPGMPPEQYVPDTRRARTELGLRETVGLEEAIRRTAAWARSEISSAQANP